MDVRNVTQLPQVRQRDERISVTCVGCGEERTILRDAWLKRKSDYCKPCGRRVRAGFAPTANFGRGTRLGNIWAGMRQRCGLIGGAPESTLANYAGRGIRLCEEWACSFEAFKAWALSSGYRDDLLLDREDNDGDYTPGNCRWVTWTASNRNKRNIRLDMKKADEIRSVLASGNFTSLRQIARDYGVTEMTISQIKFGKGWVPE